MQLRKTKETKMVEALLSEYFPNHPPEYPPAAYRPNSTAIHVRLVDDSFKHIHWMDRNDVVDPILRLLPKKTQFDISRLFLFAPDEVEGSGLNYEFEHPSPIPRIQARSRNGTKATTSRKTRPHRGAQ